ncbi:hypothetical protein MBLNU13_g01706t1 [Cladosporium sp. NU13]
MFPHREELITPPHSLRRRQEQQSRHSEAGPPGFDLRSGPVISCTSNQMLDLSICHPSQAFSNRFSLLATPPPTKPSSLFRDFPATGARRTRNSRGTKEAKKCRDMRRNRRKLAAQILDHQLSQAVDETLTKANYAPPPRPCLFPTSQNPVTARPQPAYFPSMPPELPPPDFFKFDLAAFPHFTIASTTPPPLRTPTPFRTLPKWCPRIPSLTLGDVWRDSFPTFHDLSSLPEPVEASRAPSGATPTPCKDLQVWRPIGVGYGRDQSRFFPSRSRSTPEGLSNERGIGVTVKLPPPMACRLHRSDNSASSSSATPISQHSVSQAILAAFAEINRINSPPNRRSEQSQCSTWAKNEKSKPSPTLPNPAGNTLDKPSVNTPEDVHQTSQTSDTACNNSTSCPTEMMQTTTDAQERQNPADCYFPRYNDEQPVYELDGREIEIPYVHANSLTGYSNDQGVLDTILDYEKRQYLADSGVNLNIIISGESREMVGLNELVVDHDIMTPAYTTSAAGVPLPISLPATPPATPPLHPLSDMATILPVDCITEAEYAHSDAHYCSEQALFSSPLSLAQSTEMLHGDVDSSSINIADFLKLGHAKQCWCGHCTDEPYDLARSGANESISSSATLADWDLDADVEDDLTVSLLLHPSESKHDTESDDSELLDCSEANNHSTQNDDDVNVATVECEDWLLFSPAAVKPAEESTLSGPTMYLPSSPILHRQRQHRAAAPTVVITTSEPCANEPSDDYITVAAPTTASTSPTTTNMAWHDMFPRRSSSMWNADLATYETKSFGLGSAKARRGSWRWGRESEEEWWDWAVEEEC